MTEQKLTKQDDEAGGVMMVAHRFLTADDGMTIDTAIARAAAQRDVELTDKHRTAMVILLWRMMMSGQTPNEIKRMLRNGAGN